MLAYIFVVLAILVKLKFVLPWNFTPLMAALLFFGAHVSRKYTWIPIVALIGADVYLTKIAYGYALTPDHVVTWAYYVAVVLIGGGLLRDARAVRIAGVALGTSVTFFLVSNFAVWLAWPGTYARSFAGLEACYIAAIPFFRNTLAGDLLFTAVMFSIPALLGMTQRKPHEAKL